MKTLIYFLLIFVGLVCSPNLAQSQKKSIDCECKPDEVSGWTLLLDKGKGICVTDVDSIELVFYKAESVTPSELLGKTDNRSLNACVLKHLLANKMVPESWKNKQIAFPWPRYADGGGNELIRFLKWYPDSRGWTLESIYLNSPLVYEDTFVAVKKQK